MSFVFHPKTDDNRVCVIYMIFCQHYSMHLINTIYIHECINITSKLYTEPSRTHTLSKEELIWVYYNFDFSFRS